MPRGKPFKPGQSGNPKGRPRVDENLRELAKSHSLEALEKLVAVMRSPKASNREVIAAASAILDRGYGRPAQAVTVESVQLPRAVIIETPLTRQVDVAVEE